MGNTAQMLSDSVLFVSLSCWFEIILDIVDIFYCLKLGEAGGSYPHCKLIRLMGYFSLIDVRECLLLDALSGELQISQVTQ
jgi:hypothetical protein